MRVISSSPSWETEYTISFQKASTTKGENLIYTKSHDSGRTQEQGQQPKKINSERTQNAKQKHEEKERKKRDTCLVSFFCD